MTTDQVFRGVKPRGGIARRALWGSWLALVCACSGTIEQTDLDIAKADAASRGAPTPAPASSAPAPSASGSTARPASTTPPASSTPASTPPASSTPPAAATPPASSDLSFATDIWPIFSAKCAPCHTGAGFGNQDIGGADKDAAFEDTVRIEAKLISDIETGRMPPTGCGGPPGSSASCISAAEFELIEDWFDADAPP